MIYKNESKHRLYEQDDKLRCALGKRQIIKYVCSEASIYRRRIHNQLEVTIASDLVPVALRYLASFSNGVCAKSWRGMSN